MVVDRNVVTHRPAQVRLTISFSSITEVDVDIALTLLAQFVQRFLGRFRLFRVWIETF